VIDRLTRPAALDDMTRRGVRGIRLNLATAGQTDPLLARQRLLTAMDQIAGRPWHIQMYTQLSVIEAARDDVLASPVPIVFDHFGGAQAALGIEQSGFQALLDVVRAGKAYVKLSAPYRSSSQTGDYADVTPLAQALVAANPQRILWGTDWPHPDSSPGDGRTITATRPFQEVDDGRVCNQFAVWAPDAATRRTILVDNPARLYGF
jgi:predicted TIM-barrel fold metal-dependent hydrolase